MVFPIPISKNKKGTVPFNMMMIMFAMMIVVIITIMMIGFRINIDSPQGTSVINPVMGNTRFAGTRPT